MAEGKKSFLIYCDIINTIDHLTNEEKGILFQHLLEYVNDMNPVLEDRVLLSVWKPIKNQLKRDLEKYKERSITNRENALKRWNTKNATACDGMQTDAKHADNDNDNDIDIDNVKEKEKEKVEEDVFYTIDKLIEIYLSNEKLCEAFISNKENKVINKEHLEKRLNEFSINLSELGRHSETWVEFTTYFRNWNKKTAGYKKESSNPLKDVAF